MFSIHPATLADCSGLGQVQVDSYRSAYAGFFPPSYLDRFAYEEQAQDWRDLLASGATDILLVATLADGLVIGYVLARAEKEGFPGYDAEIIGLHVRRAHQRQRAGKALLSSAAQQLQARGCASAMLWTLEGNPVWRWYEKLGGQVVGSKTYQVDGWNVTEVAYGWQNLRLLL